MAEMVISCFVVGLIGLTMASAITLAMRCAASTRDPSSPYVEVVASRAALDVVSDDMKAATKIEPLAVPPWPSGTVGVTLTVPARGADTSPETIVYAWGGPGQSLMRQYNNNAAVAVADNVQVFNLTFSPEMLLMDRDAGVSAPGGNVQKYAVTNSNWVGEYFKPTFTSSVTSFKVTHVKLQMQRNGTSTGTVSVGIYAAASTFVPFGSALATGSLDISTVSSTAATWANVPMTTSSALTPGTGYVVVIGTSGAPSGCIGSVLYDPTTVPNAGFCNSTTGIQNWTSNSAQSLEFYVYGSTTP